MKKYFLPVIAILILIGIGIFFLNRTDGNISKRSNGPVVQDSFIAMKTITAFGDSLTAGYGLTLEQAYPAQLEKKLQAENYPYQVINAGASGETTAGGLRRVDWVLKSEPEIVILALGGNDALRGLPPSKTAENLEQIINKLQGEGVTVVLAGMNAPQNLGSDYYQQFDTLYPELAKKYELPFIPFLLEGVALQPDLNQSDGIHPTARGYEIIVENNIFPVLKKLLERETT